MKLLLITILLTSFLFSDEMQRIDSIVKDISKLRQDYAKCQESLKTVQPIEINMVEYQQNDDVLNRYKRLLLDEKEKNAILVDEIDSLSSSITKLKNRKVKEPTIVQEVKVVKEVELVEVVKLVEICSNTNDINPNPFPKLMPKEKKTEKKISKKVQKKVEIKHGAKTYRLNKDSSIYNARDGKKVDSWEKDSSFTSNKQTAIWIKITGYFVNKKWQRAKKELWVKQSDTTFRY